MSLPARLACAGAWVLRHPALVYAGLALLAFPITEMLIAGERALQYSRDLFDNQLPVFAGLAQDLRAGQFSLWNPDLTSGSPRLAQMALPLTMPEVLLGTVLPFGGGRRNRHRAGGMDRHRRPSPPSPAWEVTVRGGGPTGVAAC